MSCDNAISHLMTDQILKLALEQMAARLKLGGLLLIGTQDNDAMAEKRPLHTALRDHIVDDTRVLCFQKWHWFDDGSGYDFDHFIITEHDGEWRTRLPMRETAAAKAMGVRPLKR